MQNTSKTQLILPIPPASHLLLFIVALGLAAIIAFLQQHQFAKPQHNNGFNAALESPVIKSDFTTPATLLNIPGK